MRHTWKATSTLWVLGCAVLSLLGGCGQAETSKKPAAIVLKGATETLSEQELQKFLRLVSRLPDGKVPEFTPSTQPDLDSQLPSKVLVSEFRSRFRFLCDPKRQGEAWSKNQELVKSAAQEGWSTAQLAAFMRCLSCAVMKSRLSAKHNLTEIEARCREEISNLVTVIERDDERPRSTMDEAFQTRRTEKVDQLARMVALLEFTLQIKPVPQDNVKLIQEHESDIRDLLPKAALQDPYISAFEKHPSSEIDEGGIVPVGYEKSSPSR